MRPQILTTENVLTQLVAPAGARVAAMLGTARWGPIDEVTSISSLNDFVNTFKDDKTGTGVTGIKGASLFFRNGGTLKFARITDGTESKSDYTAQNATTDVIVFEGLHAGTHGDNISLTVTANGSNRDLVVTDGSRRELYNNNGAGYATNQALADAVNADSLLVTAAVEAGQETINLLDAFTETFLTGGADGETSITQTILETAFDDLLLTEDFNFLVIPGETADALHSSISSRLDDRAVQEKKYSRYITGIDSDETIATAVARTSSGRRLSVCAPGCQAQHRVDDTTLDLDASYTACAYAGKLCAIDLEVSGTHETVSVDNLIVDTATGKRYYSKAEQEELLQGRILPLSLINTTIQVVRGVTRETSTTSIFFDEVIVDIVDEVRKTAEEYLDTTVGKPNTGQRRAIYAERLDALLGLKQREGVIESFEPSTVEEGASPDTFQAQLNIKPTFNTNFVQLTLNISS